MGKRFIALSAVSLCVLATSAAHADTYRFLSKDDEGAASFINETSINRVGDGTTVWSLTITGEYMNGGVPELAYYLMQHSLNCRTQRIRPAAMSTYTATGERVHSDDKGDVEGPVEPGTIEWDIYKAVCQQGKKAARGFEAQSPHRLAKEFRDDVLQMKEKK